MDVIYKIQHLWKLSWNKLNLPFFSASFVQQLTGALQDPSRFKFWKQEFEH